jgi:hypothetical protein
MWWKLLIVYLLALGSLLWLVYRAGDSRRQDRMLRRSIR